RFAPGHLLPASGEKARAPKFFREVPRPAKRGEGAAKRRVRGRGGARVFARSTARVLPRGPSPREAGRGCREAAGEGPGLPGVSGWSTARKNLASFLEVPRPAKRGEGAAKRRVTGRGCRACAPAA